MRWEREREKKRNLNHDLAWWQLDKGLAAKLSKQHLRRTLGKVTELRERERDKVAVGRRGKEKKVRARDGFWCV